MSKLPKNWHELQPYAVGFFRIKAGYIPNKMPLDYDWIGELLVTVKERKMTHVLYFEHIECDKLIVLFPTVCDHCMYYIRRNLTKHQDIGLCTICGTLPAFEECELCGILGIEAELPY